jgi:uncharacterized protein YegL
MAKIAIQIQRKESMAQNEFVLRQEELVENPTPRVPICLVLDTSGSMGGDPISELASGVKMFFDTIKDDEIAKYSAEISVVTFGGEVKKNLDFLSIERQEIPYLSADGQTPMGEAVELALDMLEHRKMDYKNAGVDYYQPWLVLMTDGNPSYNISNAITRIKEQVNGKKLSVFAIAIGDADIETLSKFTPSRPPLRLKGLNFKEFFIWLSRSVSRVSQSTPGEKVPLDLPGIAAWGEV